MEKLNEYQGTLGRLHQIRDNLKEKFDNIRNQENFITLASQTANDHLKGNTSADQDFSHIYRHKTRWELIKVSAAVMGIEFSYAAETAFVSPTLLQIGVEHRHMTLVWALSPLVGFFLCPFLGSMSDRCKLNIGRRRPFILLLSVGVLLGLMLVPNGEDIGYLFGDEELSFDNITSSAGVIAPHRTTSSQNEIIFQQKTSHPWGIFFTVLGTVLLDFDADACQSPARAYLLDVCTPEDHARGLSTFTIMAGLGGFMGYSMGGINWDSTALGKKLGGHVKAVFTIITFIFIACVAVTVTSFKEIPLWVLSQPKKKNVPQRDTNYGSMDMGIESTDFGEQSFRFQEVVQNSDNTNVDVRAFEDTSLSEHVNNEDDFPRDPNDTLNEDKQPPLETVESLSYYLLSIVYMPHSLKMLCLTNLFCWMAHVCYSLYFTDFVGEAVFHGDPRAPFGSLEQIRYEEGIRFGCFGMAMYSLSCSCYSLVIERLIQQFKAKKVYIGGLLFYCVGMTLMALTRAKASVIVFSWAAGVMYSTLFTMPYLLVAHYHSMGVFEKNDDGTVKMGSTVRGLGTDISIVSSMVFLAQFILSLCMGTIVTVSGTTTAVVSTASFLSFCGAIAATKVMYLDL